MTFSANAGTGLGCRKQLVILALATAVACLLLRYCIQFRVMLISAQSNVVGHHSYLFKGSPVHS